MKINNSQQPKVLACQGGGESAESLDSNRNINSGYPEGGRTGEYSPADTNMEDILGSKFGFNGDI